MSQLPRSKPEISPLLPLPSPIYLIYATKMHVYNEVKDEFEERGSPIPTLSWRAFHTFHSRMYQGDAVQWAPTIRSSYTLTDNEIFHRSQVQSIHLSSLPPTFMIDLCPES